MADHEWHDITRVGSNYAEETCARTGKRRHRHMRMPDITLGRRGLFDRAELYGVNRGVGEWKDGPAPGSNYRAPQVRES
jgi:hypothetical protein